MNIILYHLTYTNDILSGMRLVHHLVIKSVTGFFLVRMVSLSLNMGLTGLRLQIIMNRHLRF
ncbi:hypothetical protein DL151_25505 [Salmonella enterica subsp. salamae]|nr:hypothetical protein [Salmonella enterica subsp. salamae]MEI04991.1 hypothetical protein [Salmonella enterica]MJG41963.1 hypothetical protein [Salmonella enterica subsp. salamae]